MAEQQEKAVLKRLQELIQHTVKDNILLLKMEIADDVSRIINLMIVGIIAGFLLFMFLLFISFLGAAYLGEVLDSRGAGYAIVAGIYLVFTLLLVFVFRKPIGKKIDSAILNALFNKPGTNHHHEVDISATANNVKAS